MHNAGVKKVHEPVSHGVDRTDAGGLQETAGYMDSTNFMSSLTDAKVIQCEIAKSGRHVIRGRSGRYGKPKSKRTGAVELWQVSVSRSKTPVRGRV